MIYVGRWEGGTGPDAALDAKRREWMESRVVIPEKEKGMGGGSLMM